MLPGMPRDAGVEPPASFWYQSGGVVGLGMTGFRDTGILGRWDTGALGYWALGYWELQR
jgi:hypothetical protein